MDELHTAHFQNIQSSVLKQLHVNYWANYDFTVTNNLNYYINSLYFVVTPHLYQVDSAIGFVQKKIKTEIPKRFYLWVLQRL